MESPSTGRALGVSLRPSIRSSDTTAVITVPSPSALSHEIEPRISPARRAQIARPSPVPACSRLVEESICVKGSKRSAWASGAIPIPVSRTVNRSWISFSSPPWSSARIATSPAGVNFTALPTRFRSTWRNRDASPRTRSGIASDTDDDSQRSRRRASTATTSRAPSTTALTSISLWSSVSLRASIFEKSRMSFSSERSASVDRCRTVVSSRCSASSDVAPRGRSPRSRPTSGSGLVADRGEELRLEPGTPRAPGRGPSSARARRAVRR